jgi:uncharacterized membrane protein YkgB
MKNFGIKIAIPFSRFAIFFIYFYFGALKVFAEHGAANPMVVELLHRTMPVISPDSFLIFLGVFEMIVGILFLIPKLSKLALGLIAVHLLVTIMPLFLMVEYTWRNFLVPTMEGQYILKNILILALAISIFASLPDTKENA